MAKVNKDVIIKVATYAAGAGLTYFLIVKPILTKLGLVKSADQLAAEQAGIKLPVYNPSGSGYTYTINKSTAQSLADNVWSSFNWFGINASSYILNSFKQCKTQGDINLMVTAFNNSHTVDFYEFLKTGGGLFFWDGLSSSELTTLNNYVSNLPK
jgi:hypothetical protein